MRVDRDHDRRIASMFDTIAPRYDVLNRVLSFGTDVGWRRRALALAEIAPGHDVLDIGAGTGDLAIAIRRGRGARVVALDLAPRMLRIARGREPGLACVVATVDALPFADASLDRIVTGFTVRNVADLPRAFREMRRVLRPGGRAVILELSHPPNRAFNAIYRLYFERIGPRLAVALGGDREAYEYLPRSLRRFPRAEQLTALLRDGGFTRVRVRRLLWGVAAIHVAE